MGELTRFVERLDGNGRSGLGTVDRLVLRFDERQKARLRTRLESGREAGIQLERGTILRGGDLLRSAGGEIVRVVAADEPVSLVRSDDPLALARAAYHLGNRHVHLELGPGFLRYLADHVLDHMVAALGLSVTREQAPFEPEGGAYSRGHDHGHGHRHDHSHDHSHGDSQRHFSAHTDDASHTHGPRPADEHSHGRWPEHEH